MNLGVTQPTLSHQIKALEDEVGTLLFDRIGKKTAITEAGTILLKHCRNVFNSLESARGEISELQLLLQGNLSIGALTGELNQLVSTLLVDFHKSYPQIKLKVIGSDNLIERVIQNEIDFAVTILPTHDERISTELLYEEELYLIVSSQHPLAQTEKVDLDDIIQLPLILFPKTYRCRQQIDDTCQLKGIILKPIIETDTPETIVNLVETQAGVSILSKTLINIWNNKNIKIIKIENPAICRQVGLIYHKEKYIGSAAREFMSLIKKLKVSDF
nr:LysR family transcriptional regulator [Paenibacillus psychroresistens]